MVGFLIDFKFYSNYSHCHTRTQSKPVDSATESGRLLLVRRCVILNRVLSGVIYSYLSAAVGWVYCKREEEEEEPTTISLTVLNKGNSISLTSSIDKRPNLGGVENRQDIHCSLNWGANSVRAVNYII